IGGQRIGGVRVGLSRDNATARELDVLEPLAQRLQAASNEHLFGLLILLGCLVLLGVAATVRVQRRSVQPITGLAEAAARIEQGRYAEVDVRSERRDEIGDLVRA